MQRKNYLSFRKILSGKYFVSILLVGLWFFFTFGFTVVKLDSLITHFIHIYILEANCHNYNWQMISK